MSTAEIRRDPILGHRTIFAPHRGERPVVSVRESCSTGSVADDPFLIGNEDETPAELFRIPDAGSDWRVRVVPNRYPALAENAAEPIAHDDPFQSFSAIGQHEVIVECPHFEEQLSALSVDQIAAVLTAWRSRLVAVHSKGYYDYALIFKNSGQNAGASLPHSHSQLIAMPKAPIAIQTVRAATWRRFHRERGVAVQDYVLERECQQDRTVTQTGSLAVFCPFASRFPCETWIVPAGRFAPFVELDDSAVRDLAELLRAVIRSVLTEHPNAAYNVMLHATPFSQMEEPWFRWRIEICPRVAKLAGFEIATGMYINTVLPKVAAAKLREHLESPGTA